MPGAKQRAKPFSSKKERRSERLSISSCTPKYLKDINAYLYIYMYVYIYNYLYYICETSEGSCSFVLVCENDSNEGPGFKKGVHSIHSAVAQDS